MQSSALVQQARCRTHFSGARSGIGTGILGPHVFSHVRRIWELEPSSSIFVLSLASCIRSSGWTTLRISLDHSCTIFSRSPLLLPSVFLTLRVSSSSNSSLVFRLPPPSSSARAFQWSRLRLTLLTRELLPHRSFIFPCCLDEEVECLVNQGCCFLGSRGGSWSSSTESSREITDALACWKKRACQRRVLHHFGLGV